MLRESKELCRLYRLYIVFVQFVLCTHYINYICNQAKSWPCHKFSCPIGAFPFYMLIETSGSNGDHDEEKLNNFLSLSMEAGRVADGTVTNEISKSRVRCARCWQHHRTLNSSIYICLHKCSQKIWYLRESIATALTDTGYTFMYDITLPLVNFYELVPKMAEELADLGNQVLVTGFGHLGDCNLHLNIKCDEFTSELSNRIEPFVYDFVRQKRGSISAEHGIGLHKKKYLKQHKDAAALEQMFQLKMLMDPKAILNPYKVLPTI